MNVLIAHNPRGYLHAISADHPAGHADVFRRIQEGQGCTVTVLTGEEFRDWMQGQRTAATAPAEPTPLAPAIESTPTPVQAASESVRGREAPAVGTEIVHPGIGWSAVTHHINISGEWLAVATGPKGSGIVHEYRLATPDDLPRHMQTAHDPEPIHVPESVHASTVVDTTKPAYMPSLFDFGVPA